MIKFNLKVINYNKGGTSVRKNKIMIITTFQTF
jgi:hypothetical protein